MDGDTDGFDADEGWMGGGRSHTDDDGSDTSEGRDSAVREWNDSAASGWRDRVKAEVAASLIDRQPHEQRHEFRPSPSVRWKDFDANDGAQFVGYILRDAKMKTNGDLEITFTVPYDFKQFAVGLSDVMGIPLSFDVQVWKPYADKQKAITTNGTQVV